MTTTALAIPTLETILSWRPATLRVIRRFAPHPLLQLGVALQALYDAARRGHALLRIGRTRSLRFLLGSRTGLDVSVQAFAPTS